MATKVVEKEVVKTAEELKAEKKATQKLDKLRAAAEAMVADLPTEIPLSEMISLVENPFQPSGRSERDSYPMALDLKSRGQFNPILIGVVLEMSERFTVQGHRRTAGAILGIELGILPADFALDVTYRVYDTVEDMGQDVGDHGATVGLENKWQLFQVLAPIYRSKSSTYAEIALIHSESFRQVWNTKDDRESVIRSKVEIAQTMFAAGNAEAGNLALAEAQTVAGSYRNGVNQTYSAVANLPMFVAEYMRRQWLGELVEGEPVLSQNDFVAVSKAMKEAKVIASDSDAIEGIFEAVKAAKVEAARLKAAKKAEEGGDTPTKTQAIMPKKKLETMRNSAGNVLFARILTCIIENYQSELKAIDADMFAEGLTCRYEETQKVATAAK